MRLYGSGGPDWYWHCDRGGGGRAAGRWFSPGGAPPDAAPVASGSELIVVPATLGDRVQVLSVIDPRQRRVVRVPDRVGNRQDHAQERPQT